MLPSWTDPQWRMCLNRALDSNFFDPQAMPPSLGNLTNLQNLCVDGAITIMVVLVRRACSHACRTCQHCNFHGTIPNSLSKLNKLFELYVSCDAESMRGSVLIVTPTMAVVVCSPPLILPGVFIVIIYMAKSHLGWVTWRSWKPCKCVRVKLWCFATFISTPRSRRIHASLK